MTKTVVTVLGIVFVAVGLLGFVNDPVLGIFEVDTLHNVVHILSGILALAAVGLGEQMLRLYARVFGSVYALLGVLGFVLGGNMLFGFLAVNQPDHILHILLGGVFLWAGFTKNREGETSPAPGM